MTMNKEFYPRGDVAQLCVFRKNVGRGLIGCENGVKSEGNGLGWYVKNNLEQFLVVVKTSRIITNEETVDPKNFKKTKDEQRKNEWTAKRMHGQFVTDMENKETHNTWRRMRKSDLKGCTKAFICSAQEQSIQTNYIKQNIDKTTRSTLSRMCGTTNETISPIVSECGKLAQKKYKQRHDSVWRYVHWQFCEKLGFNEARTVCYYHETYEIQSESTLYSLSEYQGQGFGMSMNQKKQLKAKILKFCGVYRHGNTRVCDKKREKIKKYNLLKDEIASLWQMKKAAEIPIVVGALQNTTIKLEKYIESLGNQHCQPLVNYPGKYIAV